MAISVMFYGLGPIGSAVARQVATRKGFTIAGGIDIDDRDPGLHFVRSSPDRICHATDD